MLTYQESTPIQSLEEFLLGFTLGYLLRYSEMVVLLEDGKKTTRDNNEIRKILVTRIPEIRKKLVQYLNR